MTRSWVWRSAVLGAALGAAAGLLAFGAETWLIARAEGLAGVHADMQGPVAAVLRAARPQLPWLLSRIAVAYVVGGALYGLLAGWFSWLVVPPRFGRGVRVLACAVELLGFVAWLAWSHAISRPALLDDLPFGSGALEWAVNGDQAWQLVVVVVLVVWLGTHALVGVRLHGRQRALALLVAPVPVVVVAMFVSGVPSQVPRSRKPAPEHQPSLVVLVGIDAFRPDRLSVFGGSGRAKAGLVAPNLESFVMESTLFTRAYTPIAQTEPAWRSLLTARWPHRTGVRHPLTADEQVEPAPTFVSALRERGWFTSFRTDCSRWHYSLPSSGFEERLQPPRGALNFVLEKLRYRGVGMVADNRLGAWWLPEMVENRALAGIYNPREYALRLGMSWVKEAAQGPPALLAFHATAAHFPGDPVYPHYGKFVPKDAPLSRKIRMVYEPVSTDTRPSWSREGSEALYDELLAQADEQFGIILDWLRHSGLYDGALVVVFSDHGEDFYADAPSLAGATSVHGARLTEEENHVVLAVKLPHQRARARVDALVRLIDIGPTLLDHAGLEPLPGADGVSLMPLLRGEAPPPLRLYAETGFSHASPEVFDPDHLKGFPRTFEAYQVRDGGVVVMSAPAHEAALREKDVGAYDGEGWLVRSPRQDGTVRERCEGPHCAELSKWLDATAPRGGSPTGGGAAAGGSAEGSGPAGRPAPPPRR
ncbi:MAG TPA: sulfatase-like hydrolase/transferase [Myxococcaceae bacterium]|jgi:arylsulfatase A-like enzyme